MARYYIASLITKCGEYDFTEFVRFAMREPDKDFFDKPDEVAMREAFNYHNETAQYWYDDDVGGEKEENTDQPYWTFNGGEVAVMAGYPREVSESTFNEMAMLNNLTDWELRKEIRNERRQQA